MQIKQELPPNYEAIKKVLKITKNTIYCYGDIVYNPSGLPIPDDLMAHEEVHSKQQGEYGIKLWWDRYLDDKEFRLSQEVEAYKAQAKYTLDNYSRPRRREIKKDIITHLSSDLYGNLITKEEAKKIIYE